MLLEAKGDKTSEQGTIIGFGLMKGAPSIEMLREKLRVVPEP